MPLLKTVHLEWLFISPELRDFLVGHMNKLEEIHLRNGLAEISTGMSDNGIHWHELFDAISSAKPSKLRTFKITEDRPAPLPDDMRDFDEFDGSDSDEFDGIAAEDVDEEAVMAEIVMVRERAERGEARVWAHITVDDKYGMLFGDEEHNFVSMKEGKDQDAWERLMDVVRGNGGDGEIGGWGANPEGYNRDYPPYASRRR